MHEDSNSRHEVILYLRAQGGLRDDVGGDLERSSKATLAFQDMISEPRNPGES